MDYDKARMNSPNQLLIECPLSIFSLPKRVAPPLALPFGTTSMATASCSVPELGDVSVHAGTSLLMPLAHQGDSHTQWAESKTNSHSGPSHGNPFTVCFPPWGWEGIEGGTSPGATLLGPLFIVPSWLGRTGMGTRSDKVGEGTAPLPALQKVISRLA